MRENKRFSVIIIDDHPIIHDGLTNLLSLDPEYDIIAHAYSAKEAKEHLKERCPDLAIIDLSMGISGGTHLIRDIRKEYKDLKILVYSMSEEKLFSERTGLAGANGYIMKTQPPKNLKQAMRAVLDGELVFEDQVLHRLKNQRKGRSEGPRHLLDVLSDREMDIFELVGQGLNATEIAERLSISRNTVDTHRINIKNKLEVANGKALDRYAYDVVQLGRQPGK